MSRWTTISGHAIPAYGVTVRQLREAARPVPQGSEGELEIVEMANGISFEMENLRDFGDYVDLDMLFCFAMNVCGKSKSGYVVAQCAESSYPLLVFVWGDGYCHEWRSPVDAYEHQDLVGDPFGYDLQEVK